MSIAKKIAIVTPVFPPYRGGIGTVAFHHARLLAERGQEVAVFTPDYGHSASPPHHLTTSLLKPILKYGNAAWVPQLTRMLKDFDTVILQYPFFGGMRAVWRAKKKYNFKLIVNYNMDVVGRGIKGLVFWYATRFFLPRMVKAADVALASSEDYARHSDLRTHWKSGSAKFRIVPNGVDTKRFTPSEPNQTFRKNLNLAPSEQVALFVGGLDAAHYFKGVEYLIRAIPHVHLSRHPERSRGVSLINPRDHNDPRVRLAQDDVGFKIIIAGRGELQEQYKKLADELGVRDKVLFTGGVSDEMLVKLYQLATVTALPSIDQSESFGIVLAESMACGTPVISSDLPGVRSVYENGVSGITVPPRDERSLASAIGDMLNNPARAKEMGTAARKRAEERYDWEGIGDLLLEEIGCR